MKIKVLIAEDSIEKRNAITDFLRKNSDIDFHISLTEAVRDTLSFINSHSVDLLILDMTLPPFVGENEATRGDLRPLAGKEIIEKINYYAIPLKIIVITQFDVFGRHSKVVDHKDLFKELHNDYPLLLAGSIYFSAQSTSWKKELSEILDKLYK
ncbi:response regulator [Aeromonas hydrophila]|nr:response regulator [Aeromonas hydrophila]